MPDIMSILTHCVCAYVCVVTVTEAGRPVPALVYHTESGTSYVMQDTFQSAGPHQQAGIEYEYMTCNMSQGRTKVILPEQGCYVLTSIGAPMDVTLKR